MIKNITKYTIPKHTMNGYRICINRDNTQFVRYISEKDAGTMREAKKMAIRLRDVILNAVKSTPYTAKHELQKYSSMDKAALLSIAKSDDERE